MPSLSWSELSALTDYQFDSINGVTNPQARLRLFGLSAADLRVNPMHMPPKMRRY